jgi:D-alanine transaminase
MPATKVILNDSPCYLNGAWCTLGTAQISVLDRGFLFGDGIHEALAVHALRLFRFDAHMAQLEHALAVARIPNPFDRAGWLALLRELISRAGGAEQRLHIHVTRGRALQSHDLQPSLVQGLPPSVFLMSEPASTPSAEMRHHGVACITAPDFLWDRRDMGSTSLLGHFMAHQLAHDQGGVETILLRDHGHGRVDVTGGALADVWIVFEDALIGGPTSVYRPGDTPVDGLRELAENAGIACHLRPITATELHSASEILLNHTDREPLAVTRLDGEAVGHGTARGRPGPVYARLAQAYRQAHIEQSLDVAP